MRHRDHHGREQAQDRDQVTFSATASFTACTWARSSTILSLMKPEAFVCCCKEVEADDRFEHALILSIGARYRPAAFFAKHAPDLEACDGVFNRGTDFAQGGLEFGLSGGEIDAGQSFDRAERDARDTDIT